MKDQTLKQCFVKQGIFRKQPGQRVKKVLLCNRAPIPLPGGPWLRWSVRTLVIAISLCCVWLAVVANHLNSLEPQWEALERIRNPVVDADAPPFTVGLNYVAEPVTVLGLPVSRLNPRWQRVRSLEVTSFPGVNAALAELPKLPHLQRVDLHASSLFDYDLRSLRALPELREVTIWSDHVTGKFVGEGRLPETLQKLTIRSVSFENEGVREIGKCRQLTELKFFDEHHTEIRAGITDWTFLQGLSQLQELEIHGQITDEAVVPIGDMPHLRQLTIESDKLTDRGVEAIAGNQNVEVLQIAWAALGNGSVRSLQSMSGLKELFLWPPPDAIDELQASRPALKIVMPNFGPGTPSF